MPILFSLLLSFLLLCTIPVLFPRRRFPIFLRLGLTELLFLDTLPDLFGQLLPARFTHGLALEVMDILALKGLVASTANKMFPVIMLPECNAGVGGYGLVTLVAGLAELLDIVRLAVRVALVLIIRMTSERFLAREADKVFGMPNLAQSSDGPTNDGLLATAADVLEHLEVALVAVEEAFVFVAVPSLEFAIAFSASVMVRVHTLAVQDDVLPEDLLLAEPADS